MTIAPEIKILDVDTRPNPSFPEYSRGNFVEVAPECLSPMSWSLVGDPMEAGTRRLVQRVLGRRNSRWADSSAYVFVGYFGFRAYHNLSAYGRLAETLPGVVAADVMDAYFEGVDHVSEPSESSPAAGASTILRLVREVNRLEPVLGLLYEQLADIEITAQRVLDDKRSVGLAPVLTDLVAIQRQTWEAHVATTGSVVVLNAWLRRVLRFSGEQFEEYAAVLAAPGELAWDTLHALHQQVPSTLGGFFGSSFYEVADALEPWAGLVKRPNSPVRPFVFGTRGRTDHRRAALGMLLPMRVAKVADVLSQHAGRAMELREMSKSLAMRGLHCARLLLPAYAEEIGAADVWPFLSIDELLEPRTAASALAASRRAMLTDVLNVDYPAHLDFGGEARAARPPQGRSRSGGRNPDGHRSGAPSAVRRPEVTISGTPSEPAADAVARPAAGRGVSPGRASGAVVRADQSDHDVPLGAYLVVCEAADADIMPLCTGAAGILTGHGSDASHIAIIARSLGLPAVVGYEAWSTLEPGAVITIDGSTGEVLLKDQP